MTYRTNNGKAVTLNAVEFLHRFVQHVLPKGLQKIRHYGLYASAASASLERARAALGASDSPQIQANIDRLRSRQNALKALTGRDPSICPNCGGHLDHQSLSTDARAPPEVPRAA